MIIYPSRHGQRWPNFFVTLGNNNFPSSRKNAFFLSFCQPLPNSTERGGATSKQKKKRVFLLFPLDSLAESTWQHTAHNSDTFVTRGGGGSRGKFQSSFLIRTIPVSFLHLSISDYVRTGKRRRNNPLYARLFRSRRPHIWEMHVGIGWEFKRPEIKGKGRKAQVIVGKMHR